MLDQLSGHRKKIAIIGGGISGMSAAYYLSPHHDITILEANARLGGHARTIIAGKNADQPVDTGFIVFNYATYPHLTRLFHDLDVPVIKSHMSFGASINNGWLEYGLSGARAILAQKRNLLRPQYYKMIFDIIRFGKNAERVATNNDITIDELITALGLGEWFRTYYLLPMCGAIWSTPVENVGGFPAKSLVQFFKNHALLAGMKEHQWWTVKGGSIEYVKRLESTLVARDVNILKDTPVREISRTENNVEIYAKDTVHNFDEVIFACHSDQALNILGTGATDTEQASLGAIQYQPNTAVLHCDTSLMPSHKACWSSWSFQSQAGSIGVTYWMNKLQAIPESDPLFVTLNPSREIPADKIYDTAEFAHPVFDKAAIHAQEVLKTIQGDNRTWFVGAYNRNGFHEDGIASTMRILPKINARKNQMVTA